MMKLMQKSISNERKNVMIRQPDRESRDVNDFFYASEKKRIDRLNREFFSDAELSEDENRILVWLCGWDEYTVNNIITAFQKVKG